MKKNRLVAVLAGVAMFSLSACTPPMPPEVKAQLADSMISCVAGTLRAASDADLAEVLDQWAAEYQDGCSGSTVEIVDDAATAEFYLGESSQVPPSCVVEAQVPILWDGATIGITSESIDALVLDTETLAKILTGQITNWNDPQLVKLNPDVEFPDQEIIIANFASDDNNTALVSWLGRVDPENWPVNIQLPIADGTSTIDTLAEDGTLAVVPLSTSLSESLSQVAIKLPGVTEVAQPDSLAVASATTQLVSTVTSKKISVVLDPTIEPQALAGTDIAPVPWQAIVTKFATVCAGPNALEAQALARYSLRTDAQGELDSLGFVSTPETLRMQAIDIISVGLPEPSLLPTAASTSDAIQTDEPMDMATDEPTDMATDPDAELTDDAEVIPTDEPTP
ncbi:unannotated protein [freshwater metagenome]|uniref:Unannotated protein n=1 Tax=freshwater metagenome TaxID=449393 RepID=A0A6J5Z2U2_9ZZZZ